jgi:hypothetical protein
LVTHHVSMSVLQRDGSRPGAGVDVDQAVRVAIQVVALHPHEGEQSMEGGQGVGPHSLDDIVLQRKGGDRPGHKLLGHGLRVKESIEEHLIDHVGIAIGCQEDDIPDVVRADESEDLGALEAIAFPAVVGEDIELLDGDLVNDNLEPGCGMAQNAQERSLLDAAQQGAGRIKDGVQAAGRGRAWQTELYPEWKAAA